MIADKRFKPTAETIKMLLLRSGNQCAFSGCNHVIFNDQDILVAECCHIEAAMPGGERYNSSQTNEDRRSIDNLLFLCHQHHVETDDVDVYPVEKLKDIKLQHENQFRGTTIPTNSNYIIEQVLSSWEQIFPVVEDIRNIVKKIDKRQDVILNELSISFTQEFDSSHFLVPSNTIANYIPRKIFRENGDNIFIYRYQGLLIHSDNKPLRVLIVADGGEGKTVFMSHLSEQSKEYTYYSVFVSLKDCLPTQSLQSYIEDQHPDLEKIGKNDNYKHFCFFLDGFDEIGDSCNAVKQINHFCNSHTESNIILSSRRNIYSNEFPHFQKYLLAEINNQDIIEYIKNRYTEKINGDDFFKHVFSNGFSNIVYNPFYLNILIDT